MQAYRDFAPTGFDHKGLALSEQQDWLVAPCGTNRDAGYGTRANHDAMRQALESLNAPEDWELHRFGHWACGWFEIIIVRPGTAAANEAERIESALADYPIVDEELFSQYENEEVCAYWEQMTPAERTYQLNRAGLSGRRWRASRIPDEVYGYLRDSIQCEWR